MTEEMKQYAKPAGDHISLGGTLRKVLFIIPSAVVALIFYGLETRGILSTPAAIGTAGVIAFLWYVIVSGIRVAAQWERGVVLRLGEFRCVKGPGLISGPEPRHAPSPEKAKCGMFFTAGENAKRFNFFSFIGIRPLK